MSDLGYIITTNHLVFSRGIQTPEETTYGISFSGLYKTSKTIYWDSAEVYDFIMKHLKPLEKTSSFF